MSPKEKAPCNRWHALHEHLLMDILKHPEFQPIGGLIDGKCKYVPEHWAAVLAKFMQQLPAVLPTIPNSRRSSARTSFDGDQLYRRLKQWKKSYLDTCEELNIRLSNKTGSPSDRRAPEDAFVEASLKFLLFQRFHEAFGKCARFQGTGEESMTATWKARGSGTVNLTARRAALAQPVMNQCVVDDHDLPQHLVLGLSPLKDSQTQNPNPAPSGLFTLGQGHLATSLSWTLCMDNCAQVL